MEAEEKWIDEEKKEMKTRMKFEGLFKKMQGN